MLGCYVFSSRLAPGLLARVPERECGGTEVSARSVDGVRRVFGRSVVSVDSRPSLFLRPAPGRQLTVALFLAGCLGASERRFAAAGSSLCHAPWRGRGASWVGGWVGGWVRGWVRGCVGAWVRGCVGAWVRGCVILARFSVGLACSERLRAPVNKISKPVGKVKAQVWLWDVSQIYHPLADGRL